MLILLFVFWFVKARKYDWLLYFLVLLIFWQNVWIALVSGLITDKYDFNVLHGTNFLIPLVIFFLLLYSMRNIESEFVLLWFLTLFTALLLLIATVVGGTLYGFTNSVTYLRLFLGPLILFWVGFWLSHYEYNNARRILKIVFITSLVVSLLQFLFPSTMIRLLNDDDYFNLKIGTESAEEVAAYLKESTYFNLRIDLQIARVSGMVKSFISNAYFLIILCLIIYWKKSKLFCWFVAFVVSIVCASKGAVLLFLFFNLFAFLKRYSSFGVLIWFFAFLWASVIFFGYRSSNEHMVGFIAGSRYLFTAGNGFGFSGNLSTIRLTSWDGPPLPDLGYWTRFQNGSESSFGVLFSSLGIFSLIYLFFNFYLLWLIIRKGEENKTEYLGYLCLLVFMQGIFQEEAFSPFVYGLVLFVAGFVVSGKRSIDHD